MCAPQGQSAYVVATPYVGLRWRTGADGFRHESHSHSVRLQVPIRLKEVVYTLSPFQQSVMSGLYKDMPHKAAHYASVVSTAAAQRSQRGGVQIGGAGWSAGSGQAGC